MTSAEITQRLHILIRIPYHKIKNLKIDDIMTDTYQIKEMIL